MRYWLKECPKCHGDLREEADIDGKYVSCLQCGYSPSDEEEARLLSAGTLKTGAVAESRRAA